MNESTQKQIQEILAVQAQIARLVGEQAANGH
jgi:hypothetical protein